MSTDPNLTISLSLTDLVVGGSVGGAATGTLRWNSSSPIQANTVYFGRGAGATGILDLGAADSFILGTSSERVGSLRLAYDDTNVFAAGATTTTTAELDLSLTNPDFQAFLANDLSIGARNPSDNGGTVNGSLTLGSNSLIDLGTTATPADLNIGANLDSDNFNGFGVANGVFDARQGTVNANLDTLNVGVSSAGGIANGTMSMGNNNDVRATGVNIGTGSNATGTLNLQGAQLIAETINADGPNSTFNFTGGRLGLGGETLATGTFNGTLGQEGGTLAPGFSRTDSSVSGIATINGDYNLFSPGTLEIELFGTTPGSLHDKVFVNGLVDLNADSDTGGMLDLNLGFAPSLGDSFLILENDGTDLINGIFFGLPEGATFSAFFGGQQFAFNITYVGGTGNDIVLNASAVPIPPAVWLFGSGLIGLIGIARRRSAT